MERTYSDTELESMKPENHKFTYEGKEFDQYSGSQQQRKIEREIRKQKRLQAGYKAAGLKDEETATKSRLQILNRKYREFSKAAGLPEQRERLKVLHE